MQVIYSNAALGQVNAGCPAANRAALFGVIAQSVQNNNYARKHPENYNIESKAFAIPITDQRWPMMLAYAYVSAMKKKSIFSDEYVGTQVMVIRFQ
jgi:hypothetical protein